MIPASFRTYGFVVLMLFLVLGGCKKSSKGHFAGKQQRQIKYRDKAEKENINDCEQLEKQRVRKTNQSVKRKKQTPKERDKKKRIDSKSNLKEKTSVQEKNVGGGVVRGGGSGMVFYLKIGAVILLGLAAIGFAIGLVIFTLASIALSILLIPLVFTVAWFVVAGIAFVAISLINQIRRRRMKRRKRRQDKEINEQEEKFVPDE